MRAWAFRRSPFARLALVSGAWEGAGRSRIRRGSAGRSPSVHRHTLRLGPTSEAKPKGLDGDEVAVLNSRPATGLATGLKGTRVPEPGRDLAHDDPPETAGSHF